MVEVPYTLIQRDLEMFEADLQTVKKALSIAQEDFGTAGVRRQDRQVQKKIVLLERLKKDFSDIPELDREL